MPPTRNGELVLTLSSLQTKLLKRLDHALMVHGISFTEFMVMFHLNGSSGRNLRRIDLAEKVGLSASGVTRLLNPMQKIGLVEKEESARDARVSLVKLTSAGGKIYREAETTFNQCAESFLEPLKDKQFTVLANLVGKLV